MNEIRWRMNHHKQPLPPAFPAVSQEETGKALGFHQTIPGYSPTPLYSLTSLANFLGLQGIFVKDESMRFHLQSFKILGSSYAVAIHLAKECSEEFADFALLKKKVQALPVRTFATATDGNHGRGLAKQFGQNCIVYMPKGSSRNRVAKIREWGAEAHVTNLDYDETVRFVSGLSREQGWTLVQDTAWANYTEIPARIMQGYLTILGEIMEQFKAVGNNTPTHVILQAGVGSFAGAIAGGLQQLMDMPLTIIVAEPARADCLFQSACSEDGTPKKASGDLSTIMAGLSCGEPNPLAWDILKQTVDCFVSCPDHLAARGMRILGNPLETDPRILSGESGALPLGLLFEVCRNPVLAGLKESLGLDSASRVLFINTEGDTDPQNYRKICWDGMYATVMKHDGVNAQLLV
ncbi:diaminopropionate ammonia-lyase [Paenibacillus larvae]|uniref:diaminopropionate ammonia-lyase n=1 Tax=Paenibacillus larvae TaxID=1464 RepID=UPI0022831DB4|nr:diaminopropionate ammonia-lyase [Paenibacillus larvae]MCY9511705.1 diaminopropionate ammonia-lyase [Paenibacillus larvae]MCY9526761.1 diaminopropionate ammonia-lyase [Paenibacillus larvae]